MSGGGDGVLLIGGAFERKSFPVPRSQNMNTSSRRVAFATLRFTAILNWGAAQGTHSRHGSESMIPCNS